MSQHKKYRGCLRFVMSGYRFWLLCILMSCIGFPLYAQLAQETFPEGQLPPGRGIKYLEPGHLGFHIRPMQLAFWNIRDDYFPYERGNQRINGQLSGIDMLVVGSGQRARHHISLHMSLPGSFDPLTENEEEILQPSNPGFYQQVYVQYHFRMPIVKTAHFRFSWGLSQWVSYHRHQLNFMAGRESMQEYRLGVGPMLAVTLAPIDGFAIQAEAQLPVFLPYLSRGSIHPVSASAWQSFYMTEFRPSMDLHAEINLLFPMRLIIGIRQENALGGAHSRPELSFHQPLVSRHQRIRSLYVGLNFQVVQGWR